MYPADVSRILPLAFLAPDIVTAILDGTQPADLTAQKLKRLKDLPLDWQNRESFSDSPELTFLNRRARTGKSIYTNEMSGGGRSHPTTGLWPELTP